MAFAYLQRSKLRAPLIPRWFLDQTIDPEISGDTLDIRGRPSALALDLQCDMSELLYQAMSESESSGPERATRLYRSLSRLDSKISLLSGVSAVHQAKVQSLEFVKDCNHYRVVNMADQVRQGCIETSWP